MNEQMMVWLSGKINMQYSIAREETKARRPIRKRREQNIVAVKEKKKGTKYFPLNSEK